MSQLYRNCGKRILDIGLSAIGLIFLLPIMIPITIMLLIANRGNPFFLQLRPGKGEKIFTVMKFKTMNDFKNSNGDLLPDEERLTRIGKLVRKTSLDETPQLINVLKGDMAIVGPRPLLVSYLPLYNNTQRRRHEVKPGITGWVGVNGRNAISWEQKFQLDIWYVDNMSFTLDCKIILMTILKVFKSEGISAEGEATMPIFKGNHAKE